MTARTLAATRLTVGDAVREDDPPLSDYAALLFCRTFGWTVDNFRSRHDAVDLENVRYHVRGRRMTLNGLSRILRPLRNLDARPFDHLAVALFDDDLHVVRAATMPIQMVLGRAERVRDTDVWRLPFPGEIWKVKAVRDVTNEIRAASQAHRRAVQRGA